jgi:hypothetical protein
MGWSANILLNSAKHRVRHFYKRYSSDFPIKNNTLQRLEVFLTYVYRTVWGYKTPNPPPLSKCPSWSYQSDSNGSCRSPPPPAPPQHLPPSRSMTPSYQVAPIRVKVCPRKQLWNLGLSKTVVLTSGQGGRRHFFFFSSFLVQKAPGRDTDRNLCLYIFNSLW